MISSRIRLARNIKGIPFTGRMTVEQKKAVCTKVKEVASAIPGYKFDYIDMENVTAIQAGSMVEEHLISVEFANNRETRKTICAYRFSAEAKNLRRSMKRRPR